METNDSLACTLYTYDGANKYFDSIFVSYDNGIKTHWFFLAYLSCGEITHFIELRTNMMGSKEIFVQHIQ